MATRYGRDVLEAVWALACELTQDGRIPRAEIRRRMASESNPLGRSVPIPKRTLDDQLVRLIKDRGEPAASVSQDQAPATMDALKLAILGATKLEIGRIRRKQSTGTELTQADMARLKTAALTIRELERPSKQNPKPGRNGPANAVGPSSLTKRLSLALEEREGEASGETQALEPSQSDTQHEAAIPEHAANTGA